MTENTIIYAAQDRNNIPLINKITQEARQAELCQVQWFGVGLIVSSDEIEYLLRSVSSRELHA